MSRPQKSKRDRGRERMGLPPKTDRERAELHSDLVNLRLVITLDDAREIRERADLENTTPARWLRRYLDELRPPF